MKIRSNYVSNSSSSSFIVSQDLTDKGIACIKLSKEQLELINGFETINGKICFDLTKDFYLTQFISDCEDEKYNIINNIEHVVYMSGSLGEEPYDEDYFNEYITKNGYSVYLDKQHDTAKQMTFNKFATEYKKSGLPKTVIVKYQEDGIFLKYVE